MAVEEFNRRSSIELDKRGFFVVEEISEDDEPLLQQQQQNPTAAALADNETFKIENQSPLPRTIVRVREFGNISPISEDFSESDKELDEACFAVGGSSGGGNVSGIGYEAENPDTSTTAADLSLIARLNCSSPILAHSPLLRKTPIYASDILMSLNVEETPPGGRKVRNIARALADISDREEDDDLDSDECEFIREIDSDEDEAMDQACAALAEAEASAAVVFGMDEINSDEEHTESFEIDLNAAGDGMACLSGAVAVEGPILFPGGNLLKGSAVASCNKIFDANADAAERVENILEVLEELKLDVGKEEKSQASEHSETSSEERRTVWEMLSDNIETHMNKGNNAGFVAGPIDHPIHVSSTPEPTDEPILGLELDTQDSRV